VTSPLSCSTSGNRSGCRAPRRQLSTASTDFGCGSRSTSRSSEDATFDESASSSTTIDLPLIDRAHAERLPVTSAARTIIELARVEPPDALARALDSALRDGLISEELLHRRICTLRDRGRYGIPKLLDVVAGHEVTRGGRSWLERHFLKMLASAGLPRPTTQRVLTRAGDRLVRVDCRFPGTNIVVELLGYRCHSPRAQIARDVARLNALVADGFAPYQFTYEQADDEPYVIRTVRIALASASV
jgi:hypothetical protein